MLLECIGWSLVYNKACLHPRILAFGAPARSITAPLVSQVTSSYVASEVRRRIKESVQFTYNEDNDVIMMVNGSTSQMRGSEYLPRQATVPWVQTNGSEQEFSVLKDLE